MTETQKELERLRTLQETSDFWADVAEKQLPALADKLDNIKLPEIDTTELAKQGENQEATNSKILDAITNRFVIYNEETGCLTIENVNIKIE
ncbi:MAG: hypothetical protein J6U47_04370 [Bacteroidales bacterium]|nr:hypothetical protein [Bacteroidales bacterium]